jgi:putative membrane protein
MTQEGDVKLGQLARFIFTAPSWKRSLVLILLLGFFIDAAGVKSWLNLNLSAPVAFNLPTVVSNYLFLPVEFVFSGTLIFTIPALAALVLTKPLIELSGKTDRKSVV